MLKWYYISDERYYTNGVLKMNVGDTVAERVTALDAMMRGKVVYIHPEERFYTVEFQGLFGSFRESFWFPLKPINEQKGSNRSANHYFKPLR